MPKGQDLGVLGVKNLNVGFCDGAASTGHSSYFVIVSCRVRSGLVVECLTQDRGAVGSSLTGVTVLCP